MREYIDFWAYGLAFVVLYMAVYFTLLLFRDGYRMFEQRKASSDWQPKISVLIPAYNESEFIGGCVQSVLNSDYPKDKLEILVLNDGSTDNTAAVAMEYQKKYPKTVRLLTKKNTGKSDSVNYGIRKAKGEIIATLDADSYIQPYTINRMLPLFDSDDVVAVAAAVKVCEAKGILEDIQRIEYLFTLFSRKMMNYIDAVAVTPGPFSMFRKWIFDEVGEFDTKTLLEDQEIALRIQQHHYKIRSSTDADVYTEIPHNFKELMHQRARWQRGGFWNAIKYMHLVRPEYGDLGVVILPFNLFSFFMLVPLFFIFLFNYLNQSFYSNYINLVDVQLLNINPLYGIFFITIILSAYWFFYWLARLFRGEKITIKALATYMFLYPPLITFFWIMALVKEIQDRRSKKVSW